MSKSKLRNKAPPNDLLLEIFNHQRWLASKGKYGERFCAETADFFDLDLAGVDLSYAKMHEAHFRGGSLAGARLVGADLTWVTIENCDVSGADFSQSDLTRATFATNHSDAFLDDAILDNVAWSLEDSVPHKEIYDEERKILHPSPEPPWK